MIRFENSDRETGFFGASRGHGSSSTWAEPSSPGLPVPVVEQRYSPQFAAFLINPMFRFVLIRPIARFLLPLA